MQSTVLTQCTLPTLGISFAIFICLQCAGYHRGYGVHIRYVRTRVAHEAYTDNRLQLRTFGVDGHMVRGANQTNAGALTGRLCRRVSDLGCEGRREPAVQGLYKVIHPCRAGRLQGRHESPRNVSFVGCGPVQIKGLLIVGLCPSRGPQIIFSWMPI